MRFISEFWHPNGEYVTIFLIASTFSAARCFASLFCVVMLLSEKKRLHSLSGHSSLEDQSETFRVEQKSFD